MNPPLRRSSDQAKLKVRCDQEKHIASLSVALSSRKLRFTPGQALCRVNPPASIYGRQVYLSSVVLSNLARGNCPSGVSAKGHVKTPFGLPPHAFDSDQEEKLGVEQICIDSMTGDRTEALGGPSMRARLV
jgi:hypothetical protein